MTVRRIVALLAAAVPLALASSAVAGTRMETQEWDCPPLPASCAKPVLVRGWPLPYISDNHGISVVGSASLLGAAIGEDWFHARPFAADVAFHGVVAASVAAAVRWARRRRTRRA